MRGSLFFVLFSRYVLANTARTTHISHDAASRPPPGSAAPGALLANRYKVEAIIGWGGQAVVYRASDTRRGGVVAVKVVRGDLAATDLADAIAALAWEGRLLQRLSHPALPRAIQLLVEPTTVLFARELIAGRSLHELAAGRACDARQVRDWAIQLCDLLTYLHTRSPAVICGDIKPSNLIVRSDGRLALIDLGAAQTLPRRPPRVPRPRHGTPGYAAPEQLGAWGSDERSDLFSLAATCYELLTGLDPASAPLQFDLDQLNRRAPEYEAALRWALNLDRSQRPPSAAAMRAALAVSPAAQPLVLAPALRVDTVEDLVRAAARHPFLLDAALLSGAVERWMATHSDPAIGKLLHELRATNARTGGRKRREALLQVLTPPQGSPHIQFWPAELHFGVLPLRRWRTWLRGQRLTLRNTATTPLRWEVDGEARSDADVRIWSNGRAVRHVEGVLLPGANVDLEVVAAAQHGRRQGQITLRCGAYLASIPWEGEGQAGLPLGTRIVTSLQAIDTHQMGLVPLLEDLLARGVLERWLQEQGQTTLASEIATARADGSLSALWQRLLVSALLHMCDPQRFPRLQVQPQPWHSAPLPVGSSGQAFITLENRGTTSCLLTWSSHCTWAGVTGVSTLLGPGERTTQSIVLEPPRDLPLTPQIVHLELRAAALSVPVTLQIPLAPPSLWNQMMGWFTR